MSFKRIGALTVLLALGLTTTAFSQSHTIRIEDGRVFIDGQLQAPRDLPESLELDDISASLSFSGPTHFRLGERAYFIEDGKLAEAAPGADDFVIFLSGPDPASFLLHNRSADAAHEDALFPSANAGHDEAISVYYQLLDGQVQAIERLKTEMGEGRSSGLAEQLQAQAEEAAMMVKAFPRFELQSYLDDVQVRDEDLYNEIISEQLMEAQSRSLAAQIVGSRDDAERGRLMGELEQTLGEIFELKQRNRRAEIEQLDGRLTELRAQLDARESHREELIQRRIKQLLGRNQ